MKRWKKIHHTNSNYKKAGAAILISDKVYIKIKNVTRDKEAQKSQNECRKKLTRIEGRDYSTTVREFNTLLSL